MLSVDNEGTISHSNLAMASTIKVPHRREVLKALKNIHERTAAKAKLDVTADVETVCHFFGITVDHLVNGN